jgi:hypothetical protein
LLGNPDQVLSRIAGWMGLRTDVDALEEMKHPDRSPYASAGPPSARYGNECFFVRSPTFDLVRPKPRSLEGSLSWRADGRGFFPETKELALRLGYG